MSREQFEAWYMDNWGFTEDDIETLFERSPDCPEDYYLLGVRLAHHSWLAATKQAEDKCAALAAENSALKSSRAVLAENTLEACNAIASAGFRHEAIMRGLYASTGNGNKYPKPIKTLVDEAMRKVKTPVTDAFFAEVRAQGVDSAVGTIMVHMNHQHVAVAEALHILRTHAAQLRQEAAQ